MGKWTRRAFISTSVLASGVVIFGIAIRPGNRAEKAKKISGKEGDSFFNVWVKISPDNSITAIIPHAEMGQGVHTSLAMMLAEELDADWDTIKFEEAPAHKEYANYSVLNGFIMGDKEVPTWLLPTVEGTFLAITKKMNFQITGGSASVRFTGRQIMAIAGAATKQMLKQAAAEEWDVPFNEITTLKSHLIHKNSNRRTPYSEFAEAASKLDLPVNPTLKSPSEYTIIGTAPPRLDLPSKIDGSAHFAIDVDLPDIKYATVMVSPIFGNKLLSVDSSRIEGMKGVHKVVQLENAVAVIADGYWLAKQALGRISLSFDKTTHREVNQATIFSNYSEKLDKVAQGKDREKDYEEGDVEKMLNQADKIIEAEYKVPFLAHATMEPMNCTAWVREGKCDLWTGSQNPLGFKAAVAEALDIDKDNVAVHNQFLGGGFGRRSENDVPIMAALIAKEVSYPVKMIWSREEDIRQDVYREATISRFKAGLDKEGRPIAYTNQYLIKHHPPEASIIPYKIENTSVYYTDGPTHVPWGNWRSVDHTVHGFTIESFIDELAHAAGKDPYQYRREMLNHQPRMQEVLDLAAKKSNWGEKLPPNWGRGIAIHRSFGTTVAEVVETEIIQGKPKVHRVVCVADPGFAVHPDGFKAQMESGIIYGLTAALYGEITIDEGKVMQSNFHDYPILRMDEAPIIETYIINSETTIGGGGEPSTPVIAPALANAVFNATGVRVRELPFSKANLMKDEEIG